MTTPPVRPPVHSVPALDMPEDLKAVYANLVRIAHSPSEMVLDFAHLLPGITPARVCARVVMSPLAVKLLHRALSENLARYEAAFGEIKLPGEASLADYLFRPPQQPGSPPSASPGNPPGTVPPSPPDTPTKE
jgi:hypothetical protein